MKKIILTLIALAALLPPCISDFSFWSLLWDTQPPVVAVEYPDIAIDMTEIDSQEVLLEHKRSKKYATVNPTLIIGEIRY